MPSLKNVIDYLAASATAPDGVDEGYARWFEFEDFGPFLWSTTDGDVPVFVSTGDFYLYAVLMPFDLLTDDYRADLAGWNFSPNRGWEASIGADDGQPPDGLVYPLMAPTKSTILDAGEPVVFLRHFASRDHGRPYCDPNQRFLHVAGVHWLPERRAYCRLDANGDIVDVVKVHDLPGGQLCTVDADALDYYMVASGQAMVRLFDIGRTPHQGFDRIFRLRGKKEIRAVVEGDLFATLELERGPDRIEEGVLRGVQVVRKLPARECLARTLGEHREEPIKFEVGRTPPWLRPAFLRPEVLLKYKADPDKYELTAGTIECRGTWFLRSYDINAAGQVYAYETDLWALPRSEQRYWLAFNEKPRSGISDRSIAQDIEVRPWTGPDPLRDLRQTLTRFPSATHHGAEVAIWSIGNEEPRRALVRLHPVVTESRNEWRAEVLQLAKIVVEGLQEQPIRNVAQALGCDDPTYRSIKLLRDSLTARGVDPAEVAAICDPLATLNGLRSASGVAHRGSGGPMAYFVEHHRELVAEVAGAMQRLAEQVRSGALNLP